MIHTKFTGSQQSHPRISANVSGYVFWNQKLKKCLAILKDLQMHLFTNVSDRELDKRDNLKPDFECMKAEGPASLIFDILCCQVELHLNPFTLTLSRHDTYTAGINGLNAIIPALWVLCICLVCVTTISGCIWHVH